MTSVGRCQAEELFEDSNITKGKEDTKSEDKPRSRLLELPAELRLQIYGYAMTDFAFEIHNPDTSHQIIPRSGGPLLGTCKLIRGEATPYYLGCMEDMYAYAKEMGRVADEKFWVEILPDDSLNDLFYRQAAEDLESDGARLPAKRWAAMAEILERNLGRMREEAMMQYSLIDWRPA